VVGKLSGKWYAILMVALSMVAVLVVMMLPGVADAQKNNSDKETTAADNANAVDTAAKKKKAAEFARGKGTALGASFSFNVVGKDKDPATDKASGTFKLKQGGQSAEGKVSCLRTAVDGSGKIAKFVGKLKKGKLAPRGTLLSFDATDASSGDLIFAKQVFSATCSAPTGGVAPLNSGNIVIRPLSA
jgi:hypothetical protein